jgi:hypothetical protein
MTWWFIERIVTCAQPPTPKVMGSCAVLKSASAAVAMGMRPSQNITRV